MALARGSLFFYIDAHQSESGQSCPATWGSPRAIVLASRIPDGPSCMMTHKSRPHWAALQGAGLWAGGSLVRSTWGIYSEVEREGVLGGSRGAAWPLGMSAERSNP